MVQAFLGEGVDTLIRVDSPKRKRCYSWLVAETGTGIEEPDVSDIAIYGHQPVSCL